MSCASDAAVRASGLRRVHGRGAGAVRALDGVDLLVPRASLTAVIGASGSGKSTLLHCLAGLDRPDAGSVVVAGHDLATLPERRLTRLRRDRIGVVFQAFNLVPVLSAADNIRLPLDLAGRPVEAAWLARVVARLGLAHRLGHRPHELSGGEQQRVAIARALVTRPEVVLADEPTGNLDEATGDHVLGLLVEAVREDGQSVVVVTHDPAVAARADQRVAMADGRVVEVTGAGRRVA